MEIRKNISSENIIFALLGVITLIVLILIISIQFFSDTFYDETLYLTHMLLVMQQKIPYRDFFDWVPPVWLYVYAGVFSIFGEGVSIARGFSTILGMASLVLIVRLSLKISGKWGALITLALITFIYPIAYELIRFYYTASAFFYVILAITLVDLYSHKKWIFFPVEILFTLATGTVQAYGLLIIAYPAYLLFIRNEKRTAFFAILTGAITGSIIAAPFLISDFKSTIWCMFSYSKEIIPMRWETSWRTHLGYIPKSILAFPIIWFPIIYVICKKLWHWLRSEPICLAIKKPEATIQTLLWIVFTVVAFAVMLFNPTTFMQQHAYYLPILCILVAHLFIEWIKKLQHKDRAVVSSILGVLIVISFFVTNPWFPSLVQTDLINYNGDEFEQIISTTKSLTKNNPEAKIFSFVPYFGMKAGGKIFPGTEYGITSLAIGWTDEKAALHKFFTRSQAINWVKTSQADLIILVDKTNKTMSCCGPIDGNNLLAILESEIPINYQQVESIRINEYWGNARFFTKKDALVK